MRRESVMSGSRPRQPRWFDRWEEPLEPNVPTRA
jgi:hypothetical protein